MLTIEELTLTDSSAFIRRALLDVCPVFPCVTVELESHEILMVITYWNFECSITSKEEIKHLNMCWGFSFSL